MKISVINGSPSGENSVTLHTVLYLEKLCPNCSFEYLHVGQKIKAIEKDFTFCAEALMRADLILFCYPVYSFLVPSQLYRFIELMKEHGVSIQGKWATQITTSVHFYDTVAHRFIQDICNDFGLRFIRGLSAEMEDLLKEQGRLEARHFMRHVFWSMREKISEPMRMPSMDDSQHGIIPKLPPRTEKQQGNYIIVADMTADDGSLRAMIDAFVRLADRSVQLFDLATIRIDGGCLGCFHCASDGACIYKDGFDKFLCDEIQTGDAIIYAFRIQNHSMGYRFKLFDDREYCNGHRLVMKGKPVGYLISGALDQETNLQTLLEAKAQVGGTPLMGIATDQHDPDREISELAKSISFACSTHYCHSSNFYGVSGLKIYRDLVYSMQGLMKEDHRFFKENGLYDFPQKDKATIVKMYLASALLSNDNDKMREKFVEGKIAPYKKIVNDAKAPKK